MGLNIIFMYNGKHVFWTFVKCDYYSRELVLLLNIGFDKLFSYHVFRGTFIHNIMTSTTQTQTPNIILLADSSYTTSSWLYLYPIHLRVVLQDVFVFVVCIWYGYFLHIIRV